MDDFAEKLLPGNWAVFAAPSHDFVSTGIFPMHNVARNVPIEHAQVRRFRRNAQPLRRFKPSKFGQLPGRNVNHRQDGVQRPARSARSREKHKFAYAKPVHASVRPYHPMIHFEPAGTSRIKTSLNAPQQFLTVLGMERGMHHLARYRDGSFPKPEAVRGIGTQMGGPGFIIDVRQRQIGKLNAQRQPCLGRAQLILRLPGRGYIPDHSSQADSQALVVKCCPPPATLPAILSTHVAHAEFHAVFRSIFQGFPDLGLQPGEIVRMNAVREPLKGALEGAGIHSQERFNCRVPFNYAGTTVPSPHTHLTGAESNVALPAARLQLQFGPPQIGDIGVDLNDRLWPPASVPIQRPMAC